MVGFENPTSFYRTTSNVRWTNRLDLFRLTFEVGAGLEVEKGEV